MPWLLLSPSASVGDGGGGGSHDPWSWSPGNDSVIEVLASWGKLIDASSISSDWVFLLTVYSTCSHRLALLACNLFFTIIWNDLYVQCWEMNVTRDAINNLSITIWGRWRQYQHIISSPPRFDKRMTHTYAGMHRRQSSGTQNRLSEITALFPINTFHHHLSLSSIVQQDVFHDCHFNIRLNAPVILCVCCFHIPCNIAKKTHKYFATFTYWTEVLYRQLGMARNKRSAGIYAFIFLLTWNLQVIWRKM